MGLGPHRTLAPWDFSSTGLWHYGNLAPWGFCPRPLGLWPHGAWPHGTLAPFDCSHVRLTGGERFYGNLATFGPCKLLLAPGCPCWRILAPFDLFWPTLINFGLRWSLMVHYGSFWPNWNHVSPFCPLFVHFCSFVWPLFALCLKTTYHNLICAAMHKFCACFPQKN